METVNQETKDTATNAEQQERTFTQSELDAIVSDRLKRERAKYADYDEMQAKAAKYDEAEEASKTELQKATERADNLQAQLDALTKANEIRSIREKVATETGVPAHLLNGDTEEACRALAEGITAFRDGAVKPPVAPVVKDGGEVHAPTLTKADILAIKDEKARLKAIEENITLFS